MVGKKITRDHKPQYWLFVTRPEYYLDKEGNDSAYLEPGYTSEEGEWWTCHKDTKKGDLIFLYRTSPRSDIGYLMQATSDAYPISDNVYASQQGWAYSCEYAVLSKFRNPLTFSEIGKNERLREWAAYRKRFQGTVFRIPAEVWDVLNELVLKKDVSYREVLTPEVQMGELPGKIAKEKDLEERLFRNIGLLQRLGYDLVLYEGRGKKIPGRQVPCGTEGGRIDLLCRARDDSNFVVIELKNVEASYHAFGQVSSYMGWVQKKIARGVPVRGLIISRGADVRLKNALETNPNIEQRNTEELRLGTEQ